MKDSGITISLLQAVELAALAPCLFVIVYLASRRVIGAYRIVPLLYFVSVAAGLLVPLVGLWPAYAPGSNPDLLLRGMLSLLQSILPAVTFLLLLQAMTHRVPAAPYWLILALPIFGGGPMTYASLLGEEVCYAGVGCFNTADFGALYTIFATSVIFLLLLVYFSRKRGEEASAEKHERHQYWLMIALIVLNLLQLAMLLAQVADFITKEAATTIVSLLHLSFIYIVLTVLFRVFGPGEASAVSPRQNRRPPEQEEERIRSVLARFEAMLTQEKIYLEMSCSRERVARSLGINENYFSRIINQHYGKRFTEIINGHRIRDAQAMLMAKPDESVTSIAFAVGFSSIPSFNRVFKEMTGQSPRNYRTGK